MVFVETASEDSDDDELEVSRDRNLDSRRLFEVNGGDEGGRGGGDKWAGQNSQRSVRFAEGTFPKGSSSPAQNPPDTFPGDGDARAAANEAGDATPAGDGTKTDNPPSANVIPPSVQLPARTAPSPLDSALSAATAKAPSQQAAPALSSSLKKSSYVGVSHREILSMPVTDEQQKALSELGGGEHDPNYKYRVQISITKTDDKPGKEQFLQGTARILEELQRFDPSVRMHTYHESFEGAFPAVVSSDPEKGFPSTPGIL